MAAAIAPAPIITGAIRADETYPLPEFKLRTQLSKQAMRTARDNGLKVRYVGNRGFVLGADWLEYVASRPAGSR